MMEVRQFQLGTVQCSLFTVGLQIPSSQLLAHLLQRWGSEFDGQPLTMPLPSDAPPEIPSIVLSSRDNRLRMNVSKARTDVFWNRTTEEGEPDVRMIVEQLQEILMEFIKYARTPPNRLASVITRFLPAENPARMLAEHFCKDVWLRGPLDRPQSFELHAHKRFTLVRGLEVNSWFRIKTGLMAVDRKPAVIVEQDINTLTEEMDSRQFKQRAMPRFFNAAVGEFDKILIMYIPDSLARSL